MNKPLSEDELDRFTYLKFLAAYAGARPHEWDEWVELGRRASEEQRRTAATKAAKMRFGSSHREPYLLDWELEPGMPICLN